jgi:hypothetical protein
LYKFRLPFHSISTAGEWRDPRVLLYLSSPIYYILPSLSHIFLSICLSISKYISTYSISLCRSYCMSIFYLPAYLLSVGLVCLCSVCLFFYLSGCLFIISLSAYLLCVSASLSGCLSISLSAYLLLVSASLRICWLFIHQFVCLSCLSASLSVWIFIHQFVCLSAPFVSFFYLSGCSPIGLSAYLVCLLVYLSALYPSVRLPISSVCLFFYLSGCSPVDLSAYLVCLLVYLSGSLFISLSAYRLCLSLFSIFLAVHPSACKPIFSVC